MNASGFGFVVGEKIPIALIAQTVHPTAVKVENAIGLALP
jgi:hypothetical protein